MHFNQDYSDRILREVEDIASRVHQLKERLAKQNVSVRLEHYWKLAHVRRSFAEFKWSVEQLEEDGDSQCNRNYKSILRPPGTSGCAPWMRFWPHFPANP